MLNIYIFFSLIFLFTFLAGRLLEKIRIPWIFAALLLGFVFSAYNPFLEITSSPTFEMFSNLGMYFLLFIIGFEVNLNKLKSNKGSILRGAFFIIFFEAFFGSLLIHFIFNYSWLISFVVALSFATVGEAILVPILDEFKIINSRLGQMIISIGTIDDVIELFVLIFVVVFVGSDIHGHLNIGLTVLSLFLLFFMTFGLSKLKEQARKFHISKIDSLFLFTIAIFFLFLGIGEIAKATALGAILAGVALKTFLPAKRLQFIESEIKAMCYGFFAPIFFLWAGLGMDMKYLTSFPLYILLVVVASSGSKFLASIIIAKKELGLKQSILLGTGLSVRFSTSIVIIKILFDNNIIENDLYSVVIASSIIFTFFVPILFSYLVSKWNINKAV
jgi:Ca2+-transporting ATPase